MFQKNKLPVFWNQFSSKSTEGRKSEKSWMSTFINPTKQLSFLFYSSPLSHPVYTHTPNKQTHTPEIAICSLCFSLSSEGTKAWLMWVVRPKSCWKISRSFKSASLTEHGKALIEATQWCTEQWGEWQGCLANGRDQRVSPPLTVDRELDRATEISPIENDLRLQTNKVIKSMTMDDMSAAIDFLCWEPGVLSKP